MTEDANGKFLLHKIEMIGGGNRNTYYWEFPLSETLDEAREKAELNLIGQAIQGPENISLTSRVSKLRFYDKWANPFRSLSINTPQESININYRSLPQYMHPLFEDAIPDGGGTTDSFERLHPRLTEPPAGFLRLVENLVIAFNQRDGCWGFRLQGVETAARRDDQQHKLHKLHIHEQHIIHHNNIHDHDYRSADTDPGSDTLKHPHSSGVLSRRCPEARRKHCKPSGSTGEQPGRNELHGSGLLHQPDFQHLSFRHQRPRKPAPAQS